MFNSHYSFFFLNPSLVSAIQAVFLQQAKCTNDEILAPPKQRDMTILDLALEKVKVNWSFTSTQSHLDTPGHEPVSKWESRKTTWKKPSQHTQDF